MKLEENQAINRYAEAGAAYMVGDFEVAYKYLHELYMEKHPSATAFLAQLYFRGEFVSASVAKGLELLELSLSWGFVQAAYNLGAYYRSGADGVPRDLEKSKLYFRIAKELGCELPVDKFL